MAHESFEDEATAAYMNDHFVNVNAEYPTAETHPELFKNGTAANKQPAKKKEKSPITPLVQSLTGVIEINEKDNRKDYTDFLSNKYS